MSVLNPNARSLYTAALTAPPGTRFDEAIGTSFSMDPAFLLEAPVYLAFKAASGQGETDPLVLMGAIRDYAKRITAYVQRGQVQVPSRRDASTLYGYLDKMAVDVTAPNGGVFHPKLWIIRFVDVLTEAVTYRVVVLTRNMTTDASWDLALQLDGAIGPRDLAPNEPLAHLVRSLPSLATHPLPPDRWDQAGRMATELTRIDWELPEGFKELRFYLPGSERFGWTLPRSNKLSVVSPFCSDAALEALARRSDHAHTLVSTSETLASLRLETLGLFDHCLHLDPAAETEDGEDASGGEGIGDTSGGTQGIKAASAASAGPQASAYSKGLHAKAYLFETKGSPELTHVVMGSANATSAALLAGKNIEILVELVGRKREVGGTDKMLGPDGLGEYLTPFGGGELTTEEEQAQEAKKILDAARTALANAALVLDCAPTTNPDAWELTLKGNVPPILGVEATVLGPITVAPESGAKLPVHGSAKDLPLGQFATASVTGLIAFELREELLGSRLRFVLNLPVDGLPPNRDDAILRTLINNKDGFIRYLLMLLSSETETALGTSSMSGHGHWWRRLVAGEDVALLEELTRAFSRHPEKLKDVAKLVETLSADGAADVIPEDFAKLWEAFEAALAARHA